MKRLSATNIARNFSEVLDAVERDQQEILVVRNSRQVARLIPEVSRQDALEIFSDLCRTIDDQTGDALSASIATSRKARRARISELRNPWTE
jgi:prevent-host-death family protein